MSKKIMLAIFLVACMVVISVACIVTYYGWKRSEYEKEFEREFLRALDWDTNMFVKSYKQHDNYTKDAVILRLHDNITSIYPFVKAQMPVLSDCMAVLESNISKANYNKAYNEFTLCSLMNRDYMENYTKYFDRIELLYSDMDFEAYDDVYYSDDYGFYNGEGIFLNSYTKTIYEIGLKLNYASGVLEMM